MQPSSSTPWEEENIKEKKNYKDITLLFLLQTEKKDLLYQFAWNFYALSSITETCLMLQPVSAPLLCVVVFFFFLH